MTNPKEVFTIGRAGLAALVAFVLVLVLPAVASAAEGTISGKVTRDAGGSGVAGAKVCAQTFTPAFAYGCGIAATDGTYKITGLPSGSYVVFIESGQAGRYLIGEYFDNVRFPDQAKKVLLASGGAVGGVNLALAEGGALAGRVTDSVTGGPIAGVEVCNAILDPGVGRWDGCDYTDGNGSYEILGARTGNELIQLLDLSDRYEPKSIREITVSVGKTTTTNVSLVRATP